MKPRTKLERRVFELSTQLPWLTERQRQWAVKSCLPHQGYANKRSAFCLDCGGDIPLPFISGIYGDCQQCKSKVRITRTLRTTHKITTYFGVAFFVEEFQVVRYFELRANYKKGRPANIYISKILEDWILPDGKVTKIGLQHNLNYYIDTWSGSWSIRHHQSSHGYYAQKYGVYPAKYYPLSKFKPEYRRLGVSTRMVEINLPEAIKLLPLNPKAETLLKAGYQNLLGKCIDEGYKISEFWPSIRICIRNNYKVRDASMWLDYMDLLKWFGKDLHNAKYVCPKNLKREHDRLVRKKEQILERRRLEQKRQEMEEAQRKFEEHIAAFKGMLFSNGLIAIKVLESVQEFDEEGKALKHCVFTNDYYTKTGSLILFARLEGAPIETIEVSLETMKVVQARGMQNKLSEYHNDIVSLVRKNIPKIRKAYKAALKTA